MIKNNNDKKAIMKKSNNDKKNNNEKKTKTSQWTGNSEHSKKQIAVDRKSGKTFAVIQKIRS